jgi:hypothetical protein
MESNRDEIVQDEDDDQALDRELDTYEKLSPSNSTGCNIYHLQQEDDAFLFKSERWENAEMYVDLRIYGNTKVFKETKPQDQWRVANFRGKILAGGKHFNSVDSQNVVKAAKRLRLMMIRAAKNKSDFPDLTTVRK